MQQAFPAKKNKKKTGNCKQGAIFPLTADEVQIIIIANLMELYVPVGTCINSEDCWELAPRPLSVPHPGYR